MGKPTGFSTNPCPPEVCSGEGGSLKNITWDIYGNPLTKTDFNNRVTTTTWDGPRALPLSITEATGTPQARTTTYTWHATKRLPLTKVEPIKVGASTGTRTTTYTYDTAGHVTHISSVNSINAEVRQSSFTYNAMGLLETTTDPRGKVSTYDYDTQGNLTSIENAESQVTSISDYTQQGNPGKMTDPNGLETVLTYDERQRVSQIKRGSAATHWETWSLAYLPIGKIDTLTRPDGIVYKMLYDSAHDLIEVQERTASNALIGKRVFTLDLMGRLTKEEMFDDNGTLLSTRGQSYSTLSRLTNATGAQSQATVLTYDADGNVTGVKDPLLHTKGATFDALHRTITLVDELNKTSAIAYDPQDNVVTATDSRGVVTGYQYSAFNDLLTVTIPDRGTWQYSVDASGNRIETVDPRGVEATTVYDDLARPTSTVWDSTGVSGSAIGFVAGARSVSYTWDSCTNGIGRLCAKTDHAGTTGYSYDLWGRLTGQAFVPAGETITLSTGYGYDNAGRQDAMTYPSGKALVYTYGPDSRISTMAWASATQLEDMSWRPFDGAINGWKWSAVGIPSTKSQVAFTYDLDGRLSHISDIDDIDLVHDLDDRLTATDYLAEPSKSQVYGYDNANRLTSSDTALWPGAMGYTYDNVGNRTQKTWNGDSWAYAYGLSDNKLTSVTPAPGGVPGSPLARTYDAMGNTVTDGYGKSYGFDAQGRMVTASAGGSSLTFVVGSDGLRTRKTVTGVGASGALYAYDDQRRLIGVYEPDGSGGFTVNEELVYLGGEWRLAGTVRGQVVGGTDGTFYPVLSNQIGAPRVVLDPSSGDSRWEWEAKEAFGYQDPNETPGSSGAFRFDARFPGQWSDPETGLFYNGFRDYDPKTGRYVESDPIGLGGGWNTYGYVRGNPLAGIDTLGLRDILVHIWSGMVGHSMATELDGKTILNQYPLGGTWHSRLWDYNSKPNDDSFSITKNGQADFIFMVSIKNDMGFDREAAAQRARKFWTVTPSSKMETNCALAVGSSLRSGGINVYERRFVDYFWSAPHPNSLAKSLLELSQMPNSGVVMVRP